jgi:hypothetical protein
MKYLSVVKKTPASFFAQFTNGATTKSHDAACFFMALQDKDVPAADIESYIKLGEMIDTGHDWTEIRSIAATFTGKGVAA